jgi:hypothetical protein
MVVLKKQFDERGNLILQAVVENDVVKSIRLFESNGHEVSAKAEDFVYASDGTIQPKGAAGMTKMASLATQPSAPQRSLVDMYDEFKRHDAANRPAENYEKRTDAVSGMKMTEQAFKDLGAAMEEMSKFAITKFDESVKKIQNAKAALGGNNNAEREKEN